MTQASYNDIAQWYDQFLRERPIYTEVILNIPSAGSSPAILTNANGSRRTRTESAAGSETITACSARISIS